MDSIVHQLADLLWGALPTAIIVFAFYLFLRWSFWRPLERVLAQRQAATEGARRQAEELMAGADEKLRQYEEALRQARAEIYRQQEAARHAALDERSRILHTTREQANQSARQARLDIARDVEQAKQALGAQSQLLAEQIANSLLAPKRPATGSRRGRNA